MAGLSISAGYEAADFVHRPQQTVYAAEHAPPDTAPPEPRMPAGGLPPLLAGLLSTGLIPLATTRLSLSAAWRALARGTSG